MTEEDDLDELRKLARPLRAEANEDMLLRLRLRVADRITRPTVLDVLVNWFRPVALAVAAVIVILTTLLVQQDQSQSTEMLAQITPVSLSGEDLYRD